MDYIRTEQNGQLIFTQSSDYLQIPSSLYGFHNTETTVETAKSGRTVYCHIGYADITEDDRICPVCGAKMYVNNSPEIVIRHLPIGGDLSVLRFPHHQLRCSKCHKAKVHFLPFKAEGHMITDALYQYALDLLASGVYTNKQVAEITGLGKNTVKEIDKKRLQKRYTIDGVKLIQPETTTRYLGIDEFKLHDGNHFATHIIDLVTGHILWIQKGKKKQVVYDFIDHVGLDWMDNVEAVACDMNTDYFEAFEEKCPHIQPVFDYFHIVQNFNKKVISEVRKDEQKRLREEGDIDAANALLGSKYILISKRSTLKKKDAAAGSVIHKGSELFKTEDIIRHSGYEEKYDALLKENKLLFTIDLIKEKLSAAYAMTDEARMADAIIDIMDICQATGNEHLLRFNNMLDAHFEGIIAHATYKISSGKIEGINQKIKTLRRQGYGYPDDEYFFLKLIDASRKKYVRNPKSHRICD
jgi:transposase